MRHPSRSSARAQVARNDSVSSADAATDRKRRRFLFALGAGSAGAAAMAAAPAAIACEDPPPSDDSSAGYRETDHVRGYYRTAKI
jgi:Rieske Fe-S protein